jgi:hypothetical protein
MQQGTASGNHRLLLQGDPNVGRKGANTFAEKSRRRHANYRKWVAFHNER